MIIQRIIETIESPIRASWTVLTGTILGYTPKIATEITEQNLSNMDIYFQHAVWTITILVGISALISWVQKQLDRRKRIKNDKLNTETKE